MSIVVEWVDPLGSSFPLEDLANGLKVTGPFVGLGMPSPKHTADPIFDQQGEQWQNTRLDARDISIGVALVTGHRGASYLREVMRNLARSMSPLRGEGKLRFTDGAFAREARVRYAGGMAPTIESEDWSDEDWYDLTLSWRAFDPWLYDVADQVATFAVHGTGTPFFPFFDTARIAAGGGVGPYLASSSVFDTLSVANVGDGLAWPVWTIEGPGVAPTLTNLTTGQTIDLSNNGGIVLAAGDTLTIDTRPGAKTLTLADGTNVFRTMTTASQLWPLDVGTNLLEIVMASATPLSRVQLAYRNRYLTV